MIHYDLISHDTHRLPSLDATSRFTLFVRIQLRPVTSYWQKQFVISGQMTFPGKPLVATE